MDLPDAQDARLLWMAVRASWDFSRAKFTSNSSAGDRVGLSE